MKMSWRDSEFCFSVVAKKLLVLETNVNLLKALLLWNIDLISWKNSLEHMKKKTSRAEKEDWNTFWKNQYSWNSGPSQKSKENFIFSCQKYIQLSRLVRERLSVKWVNANRFPRPARFKCYRHWAREIRMEKEGLQIRNSSFRNGWKTLNYSETSVVTD